MKLTYYKSSITYLFACPVSWGINERTKTGPAAVMPEVTGVLITGVADTSRPEWTGAASQPTDPVILNTLRQWNAKY